MGDINLAGYITGYGIVHKDGTATEYTYGTPVHNKIVKSGINQMLRFNGSNTGGLVTAETINAWNWDNNWAYYPMFIQGRGNHYGCLHFCQLGSNNENTNFFDEELREPFSEKTTSLKTYAPYTYTNIDSAYQYSIWITHTFSAMTVDHEIGEIGYFGRYQLDANDSSTIEYPMFSRIALPQKITLKAGEEFYCTYKLVIKVDSNAVDIENFMGIEGQKAQMKYCPFCPTTGNANQVITDDCYGNRLDCTSKMPFPCIDSTGHAYYPFPGGKEYADHRMRTFLFPQVYYRYRNTYSSSDVNCLGNGAEFIQISTTNRNFRGTSEFNSDGNYMYRKQTDYINLLWYNENGTHQFIDYNPDTNYRDLKLIVPKYNPNLNTVDNQKITFYNIYCRGYDYRLGYYEDDGNGTMTWIPQPMTKWVNEEWTFTCRTTIKTEDTDNWQAGVLVPEDYNAEFLTNSNVLLTAIYWTDTSGENHINTTDLDQEQPSLNFKFKLRNKYNEKVMTDFTKVDVKLVKDDVEQIKTYLFGEEEGQIKYEQTGCKIYLGNETDILEGKYKVSLKFYDKNNHTSEYIELFTGNKVVRE